jgi:hypothetical protein
MTLESGPAKADRNWQLVRTILFLGFALWFVYDGAVRYPAANRKEAEQQLAAPEPFNGNVKYGSLTENPTAFEVKWLNGLNVSKPNDVHQWLGTPDYTRAQGASHTDEFYVSRYGYICVPIDKGRVKAANIVWRAWKYDKAEIRAQFWWATVPLVPGLYFLSRLYKAATLRVKIDDEGMTYGGQRIALADMVSLRDYSPKGWIDLYYKVGDGEKKLRLDNEKVLRFDEIVDALCQAKGFKNEVKEYAAEKAQAKAEEEAATAAEEKDDRDSPA